MGSPSRVCLVGVFDAGMVAEVEAARTVGGVVVRYRYITTNELRVRGYWVSGGETQTAIRRAVLEWTSEQHFIFERCGLG